MTSEEHQTRNEINLLCHDTMVRASKVSSLVHPMRYLTSESLEEIRDHAQHIETNSEKIEALRRTLEPSETSKCEYCGKDIPISWTHHCAGIQCKKCGEWMAFALASEHVCKK